eukprot:TRINITY_DN17753_c0_g1_i1.p1 TRINITY_DN17753_c0_g1~~TRINITY_DN17753_c0_g1_i1.p1  ORF type:complete len:606 (-),score=92.43 TRINITY_DN17753_c0_g1_i1:848-2665(-)
MLQPALARRPRSGSGSSRRRLNKCCRSLCCFGIIFFICSLFFPLHPIDTASVAALAAVFSNCKRDQPADEVVFELNRTLTSVHLSWEDSQVELLKCQDSSRKSGVQAGVELSTLRDEVGRSAGQLSTCEDARSKAEQQLKNLPWSPWPKPHADAIHMAPFCGRWQSGYAKLHEEQLELSRSYTPGDASPVPKLLIFLCGCPPGTDTMLNPSCGQPPTLADVFLGLVSSFAVSLLMKRALLLQDCQGLFGGLLEPEAIDWSHIPKSALLPLEQRMLKPASRLALGIPIPPGWQAIQAGDPVLVDLWDVTHPALEGIHAVFSEVDAAGPIYVRWNQGVAMAMTQTRADPWGALLRNHGLRPPFAFGCLLRYLLRPVKELQQLRLQQHTRVHDTPTSPPPSRTNTAADAVASNLVGEEAAFSVCLFLEAPALPLRGSGQQQREAADEMALERFLETQSSLDLFNCADGLADFWSMPYTAVDWFFFSDSDLLQKKAKQKFEQLQVHLPRNRALNESLTNAPQKRTLADDLHDWLLLSQCSIHVFHDSPFAKTAALFGMRPFSVWMAHGNSEESARGFSLSSRSNGVPRLSCHPEQPTQLLHMTATRGGA